MAKRAEKVHTDLVRYSFCVKMLCSVMACHHRLLDDLDYDDRLYTKNVLFNEKQFQALNLKCFLTHESEKQMATLVFQLPF